MESQLLEAFPPPPSPKDRDDVNIASPSSCTVSVSLCFLDEGLEVYRSGCFICDLVWCCVPSAKLCIEAGTLPLSPSALASRSSSSARQPVRLTLQAPQETVGFRV